MRFGFNGKKEACGTEGQEKENQNGMNLDDLARERP
jgi:hypothetical protein